MSVNVSLPPGETVSTEDPVVQVQPDLNAGSYLVELVVETSTGTRSQPVRLRLLVEEAP